MNIFSREPVRKKKFFILTFIVSGMSRRLYKPAWKTAYTVITFAWWNGLKEFLHFSRRIHFMFSLNWLTIKHESSGSGIISYFWLPAEVLLLNCCCVALLYCNNLLSKKAE